MSAPPRKRGDVPYQCPVCGATLAADLALPVLDAPCPDCGYPLWCCKRMVDDVVVLDVIPGGTPGHGQVMRVADSLVRSGDAPRVVVNLSRFDLMNSAFVARLVALNKRVRSAKGRFVLCGLNRLVWETFVGARLDKLFEVSDDQESALARVQAE